MLVGVPVPFGKGYIAHTFRLWHAFGSPTPVSFETARLWTIPTRAEAFPWHAFGSPTPVSFETARLWTIPTRAEAFPCAILVKTLHFLKPMLSRVRTFAASK